MIEGSRLKSIPTERESYFIQTHKIARMATVDKLGKPLVHPICYVFDGNNIYTPIDNKPKRVKVNELKRIKNILENQNISIVIDDYDDDWNKLSYVIIHGKAELIHGGKEYHESLRILSEKYPQYREMALAELNLPVIRIVPNRIISWGNI